MKLIRLQRKLNYLNTLLEGAPHSKMTRSAIYGVLIEIYQLEARIEAMEATIVEPEVIEVAEPETIPNPDDAGIDTTHTVEQTFAVLYVSSVINNQREDTLIDGSMLNIPLAVARYAWENDTEIERQGAIILNRRKKRGIERTIIASQSHWAAIQSEYIATAS